MCKCCTLPSCPRLRAAPHVDCRLQSGSFIDKQSQVCEQEVFLVKKLEKRSEPTRIKLTRDACRGTIQLSPRPFCTGLPHPRPVFEHPRRLAKGRLGGRREERTERPRELFHENQPHNVSAEQRTLHTIALNFFFNVKNIRDPCPQKVTSFLSTRE